MAAKANKGKKQEKDAVLLDAMEKYAIENKDIPKLKQIIKDYETENDKKKQLFYEIKQKMQTIQRENRELVNQFQEENAVKSEKYNELQEKFEKSKFSYQEKIKNFEKIKLEEFQKNEEEFHQTIQDKEKRIDELKNLKLVNYDETKKKENELLARIKALEKQNENSELTHHDKMLNLKKNFSKQDTNIQSIHNAKTEKIKKNASSTAQKDVLENEKLTENQNKQLMGDTRKFHKELDVLKKDRKKFLEENKVYSRDIALAEESLEQYHNVNQIQNEKIKHAKDKIEYLKNFISQEVIKYTKDIELEKYRHQALLKEYSFQIEALKEHLKEKSFEQKSIRMLANKILKQREDVEEFFLDSIEQIRETQTGSKIVSEQGDKIAKYNERVDISELNLEDREKILRIIFAKINNGAPVPQWDMVEKSQGDIN